jgi:hypothetical protein
LRTYFTSDITLAAFLVMKGVPLLESNRGGKRFEFLFDSTNFDTDSLVSEYVRLEYSKFDSSMRLLKKRLYGQ